MVDGFPYKEEVGGSNPSVPTINMSDKLQFVVMALWFVVVASVRLSRARDKLKFVGLENQFFAES